MAEYALYKGEEFITEGTIHEMARLTNLKEGTLRFYSSPVHKRKITAHKNKENQFVVIKLDKVEKKKAKKGRELAQEYVDIILAKGITQKELAELVGKKTSTVSKMINAYFNNDNEKDKRTLERVKEVSNASKSLNYKKAIMEREKGVVEPTKDLKNFFEYACVDIDREDVINQALKIFNISECDVRTKYNAWRKKFVEN